MVSPTGIRKMRIREGKNALEDHEEITKGLECLQYDGKTTWEALLHNQEEKKHFVTVVEQPGDKFVDFYKTPDETGLSLAQGLLKIIYKTESQDTLLAVGSGNNFCWRT